MVDTKSDKFHPKYWKIIVQTLSQQDTGPAKPLAKCKACFFPGTQLKKSCGIVLSSTLHFGEIKRPLKVSGSRKKKKVESERLQNIEAQHFYRHLKMIKKTRLKMTLQLFETDLGTYKKPQSNSYGSFWNTFLAIVWLWQ